MILSLFLVKSSKDLQRRENDVIHTIMVLSSLSETDKPESFAWDVGNREVSGHKSIVQVVVVVSTINFRP